MIENNELILVRPNRNLEDKIMEYRQEYIDNNEKHINGSCSLHRFDLFDEWLER